MTSRWGIEYLDEPYPYDKLDIVAVPNFEGGGMENPGLVTFREDVLLDEGASTRERGELARGMAHELGHQWFSDSLTMRWWDELWLKESMTEWISRKILDQWRPEMKSGLELASLKSSAMNREVLPGARKIHDGKRKASEITAYNDLVFWKGGPPGAPSPRTADSVQCQRANSTPTRAPPWSRFSANTLPWCASAIFFTRASPRPTDSSPFEATDTRL